MTILECVEALSAHNDVLILTHARPDGDTLGSAAALCSALRRAGKTAALYPNPEITEHFMEYVSPYLGEKRSGGYVVTVDIAEEKLLALLVKSILICPELISSVPRGARIPSAMVRVPSPFTVT